VPLNRDISVGGCRPVDTLGQVPLSALQGEREGPRSGKGEVGGAANRLVGSSCPLPSAGGERGLKRRRSRVVPARLLSRRAPRDRAVGFSYNSKMAHRGGKSRARGVPVFLTPAGGLRCELTPWLGMNAYSSSFSVSENACRDVLHFASLMGCVNDNTEGRPNVGPRLAC
jgi:hypothetical protein